jgi:DNA-binding GntR family transcriptional regulator
MTQRPPKPEKQRDFGLPTDEELWLKNNLELSRDELDTQNAAWKEAICRTQIRSYAHELINKMSRKSSGSSVLRTIMDLVAEIKLLLRHEPPLLSQSYDYARDRAKNRDYWDHWDDHEMICQAFLAGAAWQAEHVQDDPDL